MSECSGMGGNGVSEPPKGLTKNEKLVWEALSQAQDPMKAYEILDVLKDKGVRAPMTVYRALEGLEDKGFIHKLDGLNAFVPCNHDGPHSVEAFLVCEKCPHVEEIDLDGVDFGLMPAVRQARFETHMARLEVKGVCKECAPQAA